MENKRYKLFNDLNYGGQIQEALYENKYSLGFDRFFNQMLTDEKYEEIKDDRKKQFEITLSYLSDLLQRGELKVKTNKYIRTRDEVLDEMNKLYDRNLIDWYNNFLQNPENKEPYNILTTDKEYSPEEYKQAIKDISEKWNSIQDEEERKSFEDKGVVFTLPENEWMY